MELELHPFDPSAGIAGGHVDVHYRVTSYPVWLGLGSDYERELKYELGFILIPKFKSNLPEKTLPPKLVPNS